MSDAESTWKKLTPRIKKILEDSGGTHQLSDVLDQICAGKAQIWPVGNSLVITQVVDSPRKRTAVIWLAAGDLAELVQVETEIQAWAEEMDCDRIVINGRRGWLRTLPGYREIYSTLEKDLRCQVEREVAAAVTR